MSKTFFDKDEKTTASDLDWVWIGDPSTGTYKKIKKSNLLKEVIDGQQGGYFAYGTLGAAEKALDDGNLSDQDAIKVTNDPAANFDFGTGDVDTGTDRITESSHGLSEWDKVTFTTTGTLPAGISTGTDYYVLNPTTNDFQVASSIGGSAIDLTDTGSGTHTLDHENENGYYHVEGSSIVKDSTLYATNLDPADTSEAVTGKAVGGWIPTYQFPNKLDYFRKYNDEAIKAEPNFISGTSETLYKPEILSAIKSITVYGLSDLSKPYFIKSISRNHSTHNYRIIIRSWDGSSDADTINTGSSFTVTENGSGVTTVDITVNDNQTNSVYSATLEIDYSKIPDGAQYNFTATDAEPSWVLSKEAFPAQKLDEGGGDEVTAPELSNLLNQLSDNVISELKSDANFVRYSTGDLSSDTPQGDFTKADIYRSIKFIKIYGSDPNYVHSLFLISRNDSSQGYRIKIVREVNGTWETLIDTPTSFSVTENNPYTLVRISTSDNNANNYASADLIIDYSQLPDDTYGTSTTTDSSSPLMAVHPDRITDYKEQSFEAVTIQNSDKITLYGDSLSATTYTLKDKGWISTINAISNHLVLNYSLGGDDTIELSSDLTTNVVRYGNGVGGQDYGTKYGFIILFANDKYYWNVDYNYHIDNIKQLAQHIRSIGAIPVLITQYNRDDTAFGEMNPLKQAAEELGVDYVDLYSNSYIFNETQHNPFFYAEHPGARTNALFYTEIKKYIDSLPRPRKNIKIFRKRSGYSPSSNADLLVDDNLTRTKKWKEISVGHYHLEDADRKYYDALDEAPFSKTIENDEYLSLSQNNNLSFSDYGLIEIIVPAVSHETNFIKVKLNVDSGTDVYVRKNLQKPARAYAHYDGFVYSGSPTVSPGDVYTYDSNSYEVKFDLTNGMVIMIPNDTTAVSNVQNASGTLTKSSGDAGSSSSINFTEIRPAYDESWYDEYQNPKAIWESISLDNGEFLLTDINSYLDFDKLQVLLDNSGGFNLSDVEVEVSYLEEKKETKSPIKKYDTDKALVGGFYTDFDDLTDWTITGSLSSTTTTDGIYPRDTTNIVKVNSSNQVDQDFSVSTSNRAREAQIVVWARVFPDVFDPATDTYPDDAAITEDSFDFGELAVELKEANTKPIKMNHYVGLHWHEIVFDTVIPPGMTNFNVRLYSDEKEIELARAEVLL